MGNGMTPHPHVCLFILRFGDGGVERMMVNIARGLALIGVRVDFIVKDRNTPYLNLLPPEVRVLTFQVPSKKAALSELIGYLQENDPDILLSAKIMDDRLALKAKGRHSGHTRFFLRPGTALIARMEARRTGIFRRWMKTRQLARLFTEADGIVAVSRGVANEVVQVSGVSMDRISVIQNPTITPELYDLADAPSEDPWLGPGQPPLILGIGGLRRQKDFPTLMRAFALVRQQQDCRLLILGQGNKEAVLRNLAQQLSLGEDFRLGGFAENPYVYLKRAKLFVLSSLWEGSPNVLTEALALGTPSVSTDCPSGPKEITRGGEVAPLVPAGDPRRLAEAMLQVLRQPPDPDLLKSAVVEYTLEKSARRYLAAFGLSTSAAGHGELSGGR